MASRKNRIENGIRPDSFGSNPHSKGEYFSRKQVVLPEIIIATIRSTVTRIIPRVMFIIKNIREIYENVITFTLY